MERMQHHNHHKQVNRRPAISLTIQSMPSSSPSPVLALHPIMPQWRVLIESNYRQSLMLSQVRLPSMSCLLQKINKVAPISLSCLRRACSSALVSSSLILSELSTTQMTPSVCSKQFLQQDLIVFCPPMSHTFSLNFSYYNDLMLNPRVGDILSISSPLNFLIIVVLPALSRPSTNNLISFSFSLAFLTIDINPISFQQFIQNQHNRVSYGIIKEQNMVYSNVLPRPPQPVGLILIQAFPPMIILFAKGVITNSSCLRIPGLGPSLSQLSILINFPLRSITSATEVMRRIGCMIIYIMNWPLQGKIKGDDTFGNQRITQ